MDLTLVGASVGATIQVALQNIIQVPIEQVIQFWGVDDDMDDLRSSLLMIQDFLADAEMKQVNSRAVARWMEQLEDVVFDVDAMLDEFNYEILRQKVQNPNQSSNEVTNFFRSGNFRMEMADRIKGLNKKLGAINKQAKNYGLQMAVMGTGHSNIVGSVELQTNSFSFEPKVVGRENEVLEIVDLLVKTSPEQIISVISIVGMGGLGKTTLARNVLHHHRVGDHFDEKIWVCVSISLNTMTLFKLILETLTGGSVQGMQSEEAVLDNIRKRLEGKRYLLVLDDFWNENVNEWDAFMSSLLGVSSVKGNCIIVTTRSGIVGSYVQTLSTPPLRKLSGDECCSIIKSKAFRGGAPMEFEEVVARIAQTCGGLPLAAKVVGGLLRDNPKGAWESILTNQLLRFGPGDPVKNILKLSYDRLPYVHKKCFAYCSIFPQDFWINKKQLIEFWMGEVDGGKDMETVGDAIFNHLMENSLFQDEECDRFGNILYCKMHDLVQDLACSIAKGTARVRYLMVKYEADAIPEDKKNYLRTLFVDGKTLPNLFQDFKCLYILNLRGVEMEELPTVIGNLIHLRFLNISNTGIRILPDWIGKLYNLQSLWICDYANEDIWLKILPNSIIDMISLRHLHIPTSTELPPGIGKLSSLQTLPCYKVGYEKGRSIEELGKLENLKGEVEIQNLERVKDKEQAGKAGLSRKSEIFRLVFKWNPSDERNEENVLDGLQPHPNLKSLEILGFNGRSFPPWTIDMAVHNHIQGSRELLYNLIDISLKDCKECEEVPMLGHLPCLKFLCFRGLSKLRAIGHSFYGIKDVRTSSMTGDAKFGERIIAFPALERLELYKMPELSDWTEVEGEITVFPCLKNLIINDCPMLKTVPSHFPCLEELAVYKVDSDFPLAGVCSSNNLKTVGISNLPGLTCFPVEVFLNNKSDGNLNPVTNSVGGGGSSLEALIPPVTSLALLRSLQISSCKKLRQLRLDLNTLESLKELSISDCPELESISYVRRGGYSQQEGHMTSLQVLSISHCRGLTDLPVELFECCLSSLKNLFLYELENMENLGTILLPCLSRMSSLKNLRLFGIPKLMIFPSREISCLNRSLWFLSIGGFSDSLSFDSFQQNLSGLLCNLHSLEVLNVFGKEDWDSLPDQIPHLTTLQELGFHGFGMIEVLPECIGNFTSITTLGISRCKRLRHLPSKESMQNLTNLNTLWISQCPMLAERCGKKESSTSITTVSADAPEWPKISLIKQVLIDDR